MFLTNLKELVEMRVQVARAAQMLMDPCRDIHGTERAYGRCRHYAEHYGLLLGVDAEIMLADWRALEDALAADPAQASIMNLQPLAQASIIKMRDCIDNLIELISANVGDIDTDALTLEAK